MVLSMDHPRCKQHFSPSENTLRMASTPVQALGHLRCPPPWTPISHRPTHPRQGGTLGNHCGSMPSHCVGEPSAQDAPLTLQAHLSRAVNLSGQWLVRRMPHSWGTKRSSLPPSHALLAALRVSVQSKEWKNVRIEDGLTCMKFMSNWWESVVFPGLEPRTWLIIQHQPTNRAHGPESNPSTSLPPPLVEASLCLVRGTAGVGTVFIWDLI